jgi:hypothetical protein
MSEKMTERQCAAAALKDFVGLSLKALILRLIA